MKLVALKNMTYNTRRLVAGDPFDAKDLDARILILRKKARNAPPEPAPQPQKIQETVSAPDIEQLRRNASDIGIDVDNRWGARRLQFEIDRKRGDGA